MKSRRSRRNVDRMKMEIHKNFTCLFEYWSRWAVPSTIITVSVHFCKRDVATGLPHNFNSTSHNCLLLASLVRNVLKSLGFLVSDPSRMNCSPHPRRCLSWVFMESGWQESVEKKNLLFETIRSRICKQIPPNVCGKLTSVWKRAFPSWMNMECFGYCTSAL